MSTHLHREIESIKKQLLTISSLVEEAVSKSVNSLIERNIKLAEKVISNDKVVDRMEVDLEEECLKILALHQPVATDLRYIVSVLKINNDLERIGDLAVNIAKQARSLANCKPIEIPEYISTMGVKSQIMLKNSLESLIKMDVKIAAQVREDDEEVDDLHKQTFGFVKEKLSKNPDKTSEYLHIVGVSRYLERIADHATNIAEDVMYMVEGEISRHSKG